MSISTQLNATVINVDAGGVGYRGQTYGQLSAIFAIPAAALLSAVQSWLTTTVNASAEAAREQFIVRGAGQALEYWELQSEATAALAAGSAATAAAYPMLAVSIGIDVDPTTEAPAVDVLGVARAVRANYQAWIGIGAAIRGAQVRAVAAIAAATTVAAACAAYDAITWPTPASVAAAAAATPAQSAPSS